VREIAGRLAVALKEKFGLRVFDLNQLMEEMKVLIQYCSFESTILVTSL